VNVQFDQSFEPIADRTVRVVRLLVDRQQPRKRKLTQFGASFGVGLDDLRDRFNRAVQPPREVRRLPPVEEGALA